MGTKRIEEDHKDFRDVYSGRIRKALKKFINNGTIYRTRPNGKHLPLTLPKLDVPHIVHGGNNKNGIGRGAGKPGDIIKKGKQPGQGQGAGQEGQEGIEINLDMEEIFKHMQEDLALPDLKPKPNETFEEEEVKYTSISKTGPESLRHNRRTMLQALKRSVASGDINKVQHIIGSTDPVRVITPINSDRRYRQYRIIKKPSSNAVIFFARDGSGSMDQKKCDIVSDMSWWLDLWIRRFYKRVERCYIWHDTDAQEVNEAKFYRYRYGGGTMCSSAMKLIAKQFENRFPPNKWNFYIFYFTDGENWTEDNKEFLKTIEESFTPEIVNFVGITQVLAGGYSGTVKEMVDENFKGSPNIRTAEVNSYDDEERDKQVRQAIIDLLGTKKEKAKAMYSGSEGI